MHQTSKFLYAETPSARILEMNYAGTPMAFDIVLPQAEGGLADLEQSFTPDVLQQWFGSLALHKVELSLPKFRAESSFSLGGVLGRLGMADAFSTSADFSGIDGRRDLFIGSVLHKAFVDVSEEGTEAAAAIGFNLQARAMRRPEAPIIFRADHPFIFFIRDTSSGAILFEGRLAKP
jgi:serpin B